MIKLKAVVGKMKPPGMKGKMDRKVKGGLVLDKKGIQDLMDKLQRQN